METSDGYLKGAGYKPLLLLRGVGLGAAAPKELRMMSPEYRMEKF
jgi:hypothetical protein